MQIKGMNDHCLYVHNFSFEKKKTKREKNNNNNNSGSVGTQTHDLRHGTQFYHLVHTLSPALAIVLIFS